jgi:hypothetical protein
MADLLFYVWIAMHFIYFFVSYLFCAVVLFRIGVWTWKAGTSWWKEQKKR